MAGPAYLAAQFGHVQVLEVLGRRGVPLDAPKSDVRGLGGGVGLGRAFPLLSMQVCRR